MADKTLLLVNKFYHDRGPAGGVGRYVLQEEEALTATGWRVVPFAMADPDARSSPWRSFFVRARDYSHPRWTRHSLQDAFNLIWNREAARKLDALLQQVQPRVAHLHNIYHHLTPAILTVLARRRIPAVMTLHDLRLLCPAIHMLRKGEVCERCRGGRFYEAVLGRCVKDSLPASLLAAIETAHQHLRRLYTRRVARFICPSRFYLEKYADWGFPRHKLIHLPNFVDTDFWRPDDSPVDAAYLYFGRISREKGLATLLRAQAMWEKLADPDHPALTLRLAGHGPLEDELKQQARGLGLRRLEWLGSLTAAQLCQALRRVRFVVIPSEWYENAPMSALEALATGRPLVGARIGGISELIDDGRDGCLVQPRDPQALLAGLIKASRLPPAANRAARRKAERSASRSAHMGRLTAILEDPDGGGEDSS